MKPAQTNHPFRPGLRAKFGSKTYKVRGACSTEHKESDGEGWQNRRTIWNMNSWSIHNLKKKNSYVFMLPKVLKGFVGVIAQGQLTFSSCFDYWWITEGINNDKYHLVPTLKCENSKLFFVICDNIVKLFGFWTDGWLKWGRSTWALGNFLKSFSDIYRENKLNQW